MGLSVKLSINMATHKEDHGRLPFTDLMNVIPLPPLPHKDHDGKREERFMSTRPAFNPGQGSAYGGHVFAQSVWAASFTVGEGMVVHVCILAEPLSLERSLLMNSSCSSVSLSQLSRACTSRDFTST